jgi:DNA (cytosine-5)-methyltransferase 1
MNALSFFSGIGGIDLACEWSEYRQLLFCEWAEFPRKVLWKALARHSDLLRC